MILIADSGSTKTDWVLLNTQKEIVTKVNTKGLNPTVFSESDLYTTITSGKEIMKYVDDISFVYVYAAGCGTERPKKKLIALLDEIFPNANVLVKEDIYAAAYAVSNGKEGIVSILGTGSNCCYFDGKTEIVSKVPSLGYMLMDDASGNYFGRILLRDYFYKTMPKKLHDMFQEEFNLFPDDVKLNLYEKPHPNAFLAKHASFLVKHKKEAYCAQIIKRGFADFIENQITQYDRVYDLPIHFIGSISYLLQDELKTALKSFRLNAGNFIQKPIEGLVEYHKKVS
ncbi:BadF/BadG/BcrA/BcrD ATPase family protein [Pseudofulvibacter geojedonensis]|uniref:BadF/BadG/BcrA/BcrD ATPase family protein n=1 Tax=Pseudofulvibacter geojedonensis TaxID=1123758 RepID=A0ABW3I3H2_9FLAO